MADKKQLRFKRGDGNWTRWFDFGEDFSFLRNCSDFTAIEIIEEMPREEAEKYLDGIIH